MNSQLQKFARITLKEELSKCNYGQQFLFKRMYSYDNLSADINDIVDTIPEDKLDWAMQQVHNTLKGGK